MALLGIPSGTSPATWALIEEQTLGGTAASIIFSGLDTSNRLFRVTGNLSPSASLRPYMRLNNDATGLYEQQKIRASASTVTGARLKAQNQWDLTNDNVGSPRQAQFETIVGKPVAGQEAQMVHIENHDSGAPAPLLELIGGQYNETASLVSRIDIVASASTFAADSTILLEATGVS